MRSLAKGKTIGERWMCVLEKYTATETIWSRMSQIENIIIYKYFLYYIMNYIPIKIITER